MKISKTLHRAITLLSPLADSPRLDAEILLCVVLNKPRSYLLAFPDYQLTATEQQQFTDYLNRRCAGEPIAYITNQKEFWSLNLRVTPDTLIPRPETELLIETILALASANTTFKVADLGTGSGAIALALASERPTWRITATDNSAAALEVARDNAHQLGLRNVMFSEGDWFAALPETDYDIIASNPPYIAEAEWASVAAGLAFEPRMALVAENQGLTALHTLIQGAKAHLKQGGTLLLEHGWTQGKSVRQLLTLAGYKKIETRRDLSGRERMTMAKYYTFQLD